MHNIRDFDYNYCQKKKTLSQFHKQKVLRLKAYNWSCGLQPHAQRYSKQMQCDDVSIVGRGYNVKAIICKTIIPEGIANKLNRQMNKIRV